MILLIVMLKGSVLLIQGLFSGYNHKIIEHSWLLTDLNRLITALTISPPTKRSLVLETEGPNKNGRS